MNMKEKVYEQRCLGGGSFSIYPEAPVPYRTNHNGYETWRHQFRNEEGEKREQTVSIHRLCAVAWFGFSAVDQNTVVHHKSNIPWDNREDNIEPMDRETHSNMHESPATGEWTPEVP